MSLVFRKQCGGLRASMETCIEIQSVKELATRLNVAPSDLEIKPYVDDDDRIGWRNVRIVSIKNDVVGFLGEHD